MTQIVQFMQNFLRFGERKLTFLSTYGALFILYVKLFKTYRNTQLYL